MSTLSTALAKPSIRLRAGVALRRGLSGMSWLGVGMIVLFCALDATRRTIKAITQAPFDEWLVAFTDSFVTGLITALIVAFAVVAVCARVAQGWRQYLTLALAVSVACVIGIALRGVWETDGTLDFDRLGTGLSGLAAFVLALWPRFAVFGGLLTAAYVYSRHRAQGDEAAHKAEMDRVQMDRQREEARLQMLQAQIEPHFLFNTLADVRRLYQTDPVAADSMLGNLTRYLAVALPQMRETESTLAREASLAGAYLGVQQIRMGQRLTYAFDIPDALAAAKLPPMMLLTLVENAVKHGLNPQPDGGTIDVSAAAEADALVIRVSDSGKGFTKTSGGGTGLANIRARLSGMYGTAARLMLATRSPSGITATLTVPLLVAGSTASGTHLQ